MHAADAVGDERDASRLAVACDELALLAPQERRRRRVRDHGHARLPQRAEVRRPRVGHDPPDRAGELALVLAPGAAEQVGVAEVVLLQVREQFRRGEVEAERVEPGAQQRAGVLGLEVRSDRAAAQVALEQHALGDRQHRARVRRGVAALAAERLRAARADVGEELVGRGGVRRLGPRAADVDPRVVVGPANARAAVRLDVHGGGEVQLTGARAVAHLPHVEELGEAPAVARRQRRLDGVERVRQRARDPVLVQVGGAGLDIAAVGLQPLVVAARDPEAEEVDGLRLSLEPRGQLLRDEDARIVRDLLDAGDGVVIGDRHEVHPATVGELQHLLGRRGAFRQAERALHAELRALGRGRVTVQVGPGGAVESHRCSLGRCRGVEAKIHLQMRASCDRPDNTL